MQYKVFVKAIIWHYKKILLVKKRSDIPHPAKGEWHFPGGQIKLFENPYKAIIREVKEESNIEIEPLRIIDFKFDKKGGSIFIFFESVPIDQINIKIDKSELSSAKWVNLKGINKYLKTDKPVGKVKKFINNLKKDSWQAASVVQCYLINKGQVAIFKRTEKLGVYKNYWSIIAGYIQADNQPLDQAYIELDEEGSVSKKQLKLINKIGPKVRIDKKIKRVWIIYSFLFEVKTRKIKLDWEHSQIKWIKPLSFKNYKHVPGMPEILKELLKK